MPCASSRLRGTRATISTRATATGSTASTTLNPEHPPLAKLVAALPLLPLHLRLAPRHGRYFKTEAYWGGSEMIFRNGSYSADTVLLRARLAMLVFAAGLALMLFFAGREMFGSVGRAHCDVRCMSSTPMCWRMRRLSRRTLRARVAFSPLCMRSIVS